MEVENNDESQFNNNNGQQQQKQQQQQSVPVSVNNIDSVYFPPFDESNGEGEVKIQLNNGKVFYAPRFEEKTVVLSQNPLRTEKFCIPEYYKIDKMIGCGGYGTVVFVFG